MLFNKRRGIGLLEVLAWAGQFRVSWGSRLEALEFGLDLGFRR